MALAEKKKRYTYQDYLTWADDERWEIIDGEAYCMTPAPSTTHQRVVRELSIRLQGALSKSGCELFFAPIDVVLDEENTLQPDIVVVCDGKKVKEKGIFGSPDLVVEALSKSTALKDKHTKRLVYERFGVKEYLIIDPIHLYVERYCLEGDRFAPSPEIFGPKDSLGLYSLPGVSIPLWEVFGTESPEHATDKTPPSPAGHTEQ